MPHMPHKASYSYAKAAVQGLLGTGRSTADCRCSYWNESSYYITRSSYPVLTFRNNDTAYVSRNIHTNVWLVLVSIRVQMVSSNKHLLSSFPFAKPVFCSPSHSNKHSQGTYSLLLTIFFCFGRGYLPLPLPCTGLRSQCELVKHIFLKGTDCQHSC